jgi:hypothetical protein
MIGVRKLGSGFNLCRICSYLFRTVWFNYIPGSELSFFFFYQSAVQMSDAEEIQDQPIEAIRANASQKEEESRDEMLSRHRYIVL